MGDLLVFWESGRQIISSYDSSNNCDGPGLCAYIEALDRSSSGGKKAARDEAKAEAKRIEAADKAALGNVFGALATLIRANRRRKSIIPATLKRDRRRRRRFKE